MKLQFQMKLTSVSNETLSGLVKDIQYSTTDLAKTSLREKQQRDNYQEFLELTFILRRGIPSRGIWFRAPGATIVRKSDLLSKNLGCFEDRSRLLIDLEKRQCFRICVCSSSSSM